MSFQIRVHNTVSDIGREAWDACASPTGDPFVSFDFLDAWFREPDFHGCAFINVFGELSAGSEGVTRTVREQKEAFQSYVADLVRDAGASAEVAPQIAILVEGAQTTAAIARSPEAAAQAKKAAATLLDAASR